MSKVIPTADVNETVVILRAALKSRDHSKRITAHALLLAIGEDIDPLESTTPGKASTVSSAEENKDMFLAAPEALPQLLSIEERSPITSLNADAATRPDTRAYESEPQEKLTQF